eukprot:1438813-Ditylum_brightwellii.AAC.1
MDVDTSFECHSSHFHLIAAIDTILQRSKITWYWRHVKGHQDDHHGPLDRWSTNNVEMDHAAKTRVDLDVLAGNTQYPGKLNRERWSLHLAQQKCPLLSIKPEVHRKVNANLDTQLVQWIQGSKLCKYWVDHNILPSCSSSTVDWEAIRAAWQKKPFLRHQ